MRISNHLILAMFVCFGLIGCDSHPVDDLTCHPVIVALQAGDDGVALDLINERLRLLEPLPSTHTDPLGHKKNFELIMEELNVCDGLFITLPCYGCIETFPVTSELRVSWIGMPIDSGRYIDIRTPSNEAMTATSIH